MKDMKQSTKILDFFVAKVSFINLRAKKYKPWKVLTEYSSFLKMLRY